MARTKPLLFKQRGRLFYSNHKQLTHLTQLERKGNKYYNVKQEDGEKRETG
jgi:hypothetical protein